jgi:glycosyltransferase involved in cell wall biosynthesis
MNIERSDIVASVCMITYMHEKYIEQSLLSILDQQTTFEYEIVIGNDNSPDRTGDIIERLMREHPRGYRIRHQLHNPNIGVMRNFFGTIASARGGYIALCEGDDFWGDPTKLARQVSWLEANPDTVLTCHDAIDVDDAGSPLPSRRLHDHQRQDFSSHELQRGAYVLTLTMCFRRVIYSFPHEAYEVYNGDLFLTILLGEFGKCHFMPEIQPACYRLHQQGVWSLKTKAFRLSKASVSYLWIARYFIRIQLHDLAAHYLMWYMERNEEVYACMLQDGDSTGAHGYMTECLEKLTTVDVNMATLATRRYNGIRRAQTPLGKFYSRIKNLFQT